MAQSATTGFWRPRRLPTIGLLPATVVVMIASIAVSGVALASFVRPWTDAVSRRMDKVAALAVAPPGMDARSKVLAADGKLMTHSQRPF